MEKAMVRDVSWEVDDGYPALEKLISGRLAALPRGTPLFETDAGGTADITGTSDAVVVSTTGLAADFLYSLPEESRRHYSCRCCLNFINRFGGLVTIGPDGKPAPVFWDEGGRMPGIFAATGDRLHKAVSRARVTGVFISSREVLGTPEAGGWTHLCAINPTPWESKVKSDSQRAAELKEEYAMVSRGLAELDGNTIAEALRILEADALDRSEKTLGCARWVSQLWNARTSANHRLVKENLVWLAVATAPAGFAHFRSGVLSTLLDDLRAGLPFDEVNRRWAAKMHPTKYRRPVAPPSEGTIEQAEKLVEKLGIARSLLRRFATPGDVLKFEWRPPVPPAPAGSPSGGVFGHLRGGTKNSEPATLPNQNITWDKFARTVLPKAEEIEVLVPAYSSSFYGLLTAADPEAPPILQWDGLVGAEDDPAFAWPRNPVSWYFYSRSQTSARWNLPPREWVGVTGIFLGPHRWQRPGLFNHMGDAAHFALRGCKDVSTADRGLGLFPESLRAELHPVRSVIEAHSRKGILPEPEGETACGIAFSAGGPPLRLRVLCNGGRSLYTLDRWD